MISVLEKSLEKLQIELNTCQIEQFNRYYQILTEWNKVMNLTAITEYNEVVEKHFTDSLSVIKVIDMQHINKIIDIGTGAGFPGIPLKIMYPHLQMTLLDSLNKRVRFLNTVIDTLELNNIEAVHGRAEDIAKKKVYREAYDLCVSRAVSNLSTLSEYCIPFIRIGGIFISYKSGNIDEEVNQSHNAVNTLGGIINDIIKFQLPGTDIKRSFVIINKSKSTAMKYPRKAGVPAKEPL